MPEQTYNIGYRPNDFFYRPENVDLEATIPFHKGNLVLWAKSKDISNNIPSNNITIDIFNINVTKVVKTNKNSFIDDYLPGNINIYQKFNNRVTNLGAPNNVSKSNKDTISSGNITLAGYELDIKPQGKFEYTTNSFGEITSNQEISLSNIGINDLGGIPFTEPNQTTSYISLNTANPRCKYQDNCTIDHWHYNSCKKQTVTKLDGTTYCRCVCTGPKTKDANPHSHCSPFDINENDQTVGSISYVAKIAALLNDLTRKFEKTEDATGTVSANGENITIGYYYKPDLSNNDYNIRTKLYEYYVALIDNKEYQANIQTNSTLDTTASQALADANVKYKKEYLHLFNIFSGILFVSGYIYVMNKSK